MSPGFADVLRTDRDGNLWSSVSWAGVGTDGLHCLTADGELIGRIVLPEPCAKLCFGAEMRIRRQLMAIRSESSMYVDATGSLSP